MSVPYRSHAVYRAQVLRSLRNRFPIQLSNGERDSRRRIATSLVLPKIDLPTPASQESDLIMIQSQIYGWKGR